MRYTRNSKMMDKMKEYGWTFAYLAQKLNNEYTIATLFQYASGRRVPNKSDKKKIADAFRCLVKDLF